jgi:hypothetical protein
MLRTTWAEWTPWAIASVQAASTAGGRAPARSARGHKSCRHGKFGQRSGCCKRLTVELQHQCRSWQARSCAGSADVESRGEVRNVSLLVASGRTRVVGAFPNGQSCLNFAAARLRYIAGTTILRKEPSEARCMNRR